MATSHHFADANSAQLADLSGLRNETKYELLIRQGPETAKVAIGKEKDRKAIDPPPIVQLRADPRTDDGSQHFLQSPYFFMSVTLLKGDCRGLEPGALATANSNTCLAGTLVSSLHRLKDESNRDGGFFVFADLSVKVEGNYRLQFNLYELRPNQAPFEHSPILSDNPISKQLLGAQMEVCRLNTIVSDQFQVHVAKNWPGMAESTALTRTFSDQGVRLRLRKEPRTLLRKRGPACDDYEPVHYRNKMTRLADNPRQDHRPESPTTVRNSEATICQNSQHSQVSRQSSNPNLMQRFDTPHTSPATKYDSQADSMTVAYHPGRMPSLPSSHQDNSVSPHSTTALTRADEYARTRGSGENILRQTSSDSSLHSQAQSHASSSIPFTGMHYNSSLPSSNRTSFSESYAAYTHQPPSHQQTAQSQTYAANYNASHSNSSLPSQHSPTTSRGTPYSFQSGVRDAYAGMSSNNLTSPFESPEGGRKDYTWAGDRADERLASLPGRRDTITGALSSGIFPAPAPLYNQRNNSGSYPSYNTAGREMPPALSIYNSGYMPLTTSLLQSSTHNYLPSLQMASGTGAPLGGDQGRGTTAPDAMNLSSTSTAGIHYYK